MSISQKIRKLEEIAKGGEQNVLAVIVSREDFNSHTGRNLNKKQFAYFCEMIEAEYSESQFAEDMDSYLDYEENV